MDELFTVNRLDLPGSLRRCLSSTNLIDSSGSGVRQKTHRVTSSDLTETIFAWPGLGRLFIEHLGRADFSVLMGLLMIISTSVVLFQLLTDLTYTLLDPRIRYS
jgi:ABC-type antimicrobial peptide transport system permease subunit